LPKNSETECPDKEPLFTYSFDAPYALGEIDESETMVMWE
jgi:hypothetical protein